MYLNAIAETGKGQKESHLLAKIEIWRDLLNWLHRASSYWGWKHRMIIRNKMYVYSWCAHVARFNIDQIHLRSIHFSPFLPGRSQPLEGNIILEKYILIRPSVWALGIFPSKWICEDVCVVCFQSVFGCIFNFNDLLFYNCTGFVRNCYL